MSKERLYRKSLPSIDAIFTPKTLLDRLPDLPPLLLPGLDVALAIQQRNRLPPLPEPLQGYLDNPWQYSGLHPFIHRQLIQPIDSSDQLVLPRPPKPARQPYFVLTEPLSPHHQSVIAAQQQLLSHFPGIIHTVFVSGGLDSFWLKFPFAKRFAKDSHQMSTLYHSPQAGTSFLLTTPTPSKAVPHEWQEQPFPLQPDQPPSTSTTLWSLTHQICHALNLPPAWEYLDKTYGLLTWTELAHLISLRHRALHEWYQQYAEGKLDGTTVYLYELKLVQRALLILAQHSEFANLPNNSLPSHIQAIRFPEIFAQLEVPTAQQEAVYRLLAHTPANPQALDSHDPRRLFFLTSYGTHQEEEVVTDMLHRHLFGDHLSPAWTDYLETLLSIWNRWLISHSLPSITPNSLSPDRQST